MRVVFVTDLHGSTVVFKKAVRAAAHFEADLLIIGGDLSGKQLLAIVPLADGKFQVVEPYVKTGEDSSLIKTGVERIVSDDDLASYTRRLESKGYYWLVAEAGEVKALNDEPERLVTVFDKKILERLVLWGRELNERLPPGTQCVWTGGNDDDQELIESLLTRDLGRFVCGEGRIVDVGGFEVLSLGFSNKTPFHTSRELEEDEIGRRLDSLLSRVRSKDCLLLNIHVPPLGCGPLDLVVRPGRRREEIHVGSGAVREFIERVQPLADFAGHVHEGKGTTTIGRTRIFNPGSEYPAGILQGYVTSLTRGRILDFAHFSW
jgi:Icc-related predicted phosphoesterase